MNCITLFDASATLNWKAKLKDWQRDLQKVNLDKNTSLLGQLTTTVDNKMLQTVCSMLHVFINTTKVVNKVLWHTEEIDQNKSRKLNRR